MNKKNKTYKKANFFCKECGMHFGTILDLKRHETSCLAVQNAKKSSVKAHKAHKRTAPFYVFVLLAILTVAVISQTVQSVYILGKVKSGFTGSAQSSGIQSLPDMVGGC